MNALKLKGILLIATAFLMIMATNPNLSGMTGKHACVASWYSESDPFIQRFTASGEVFSDKQPTCASWDFPFGTYVKVTNIKNGKAVICRVNDRGPAKSLKRTIDLTKSSFEKIADPALGLIPVIVTPIGSLSIGY